MRDGVQMYCGDCLEVMPTLEDQSADAIICDLPYGTTACKWDSVIPFAPMWEQLQRIVKPRGAIVLFGSQPFTSALIMSNIPMFKYEWIWEKDRATGALTVAHKPLKAHEDIIIFGAGSIAYNPQKTSGHPVGNKSSKTGQAGRAYNPYTRGQWQGSDERYPRTVQKWNVVNSAHKPVHPTQKPVPLMEFLVKTYTQEGDTVLDFAAGVFTTGVACLNTNRRFIGIERDPEYYALGVHRLETTPERLVYV